ncbi:MAG: O-antigen ligase family protein [Anaerolineae bacterium]|nr:O-antigen ligase family protein [Anaerolineae bacterium]
MQFLTQLFQFIFTPFGLAGFVGGLILIDQARRSARLAWLLVSVCCFTASLAKFVNEFVPEPPALAFPLQQLREAGRPLTIVLLGLVLVIALQRQTPQYKHWLPRPILFLILVQVVIFFKTLLFGSSLFALLAAGTFGAVVAMIILGPARWLVDENGFSLAAWSIAMVGLVFIVANGYQALFDLYPITFVHGLLLGTTGNPQHAATLLATTIPAFIFLFEQQRWLWGRLFWLGSLALVISALVMTGSRTGFLMTTVTVLLFYRHRLGSLLRIALPVGIALAILIIVVNQTPLSDTFTLTAATGKLLSGTNSRQAVWNILWRNFLENPLFGVPLRGDRLLGYGESSWLGAASALGLIGFVPLLLFGLTSLQMMAQLFLISRASRSLFLQISMVISGLTSLLAGSFFEAYLLGNLTFSLMALLLYLALGHYIIKVAQHHSIPTRPPARVQPAPWASSRSTVPMTPAALRTGRRSHSIGRTNNIRPNYRTEKS